ncbi:DUF4007 family protein [Chryseolinea soli]|nr:DUF4007 family protein [Chryseolinea soli]
MTFSGHETFQCRHLWLKKGYDFVFQQNSFSSDDAVVTLGVGRNMVNSIRFWMKAFNLLDTQDQLTTFAHKLFSDETGWDPYLEDEASLWLLHYHLVKSGFASTYSIIFNELRREKIEFMKSNYVSFLKRKADAEKTFQINENTVNEDFSVMVKMYMRSDATTKDKEERYLGLLSELDLIKIFSKGKDDFYVIENTEREHIPVEIFLYTLLDNESYGESVSLSSIENDHDSAGAVFAINRAGIVSKIEELLSIQRYNNYITFKDHAGVKELQFKRKPNPNSILTTYYANAN